MCSRASCGSIGARRQVRRTMREDERHRRARCDVELGDGREIHTAKRHRRVQGDHVRAGNRTEGSVRQSSHPRNRASVVEAQDEFAAHSDTTAVSAHESHDVRVAAPWRHEIQHRNRTRRGFHHRFEDERAVSIRPFDRGARLGSFDQPSAVIRSAEECSKAGGGVESRPAQPVDRPGPGNQGGSLTVADQRIVLERRAHGRLSKSRITLMSWGCRTKACCQFASSTRRVIRRRSRPGGAHPYRPSAISMSVPQISIATALSPPADRSTPHSSLVARLGVESTGRYTIG